MKNLPRGLSTITPRWYRILKSLKRMSQMPFKNNVDRREGELSMEVTTHCIVGEAHGFPPYRDYGCSECSNHSMTLWGAEKMPEFREKLQEFVYHWKAEHKDTW